MVIAPLGVAVIRGLIPYFNSTGGGADQVAGYAAHPAVYPFIAIAGLAVVLTVSTAMQGLGRLIQGRSPRLALIGTPLATVGWMMVAVLVTLDAVAYELSSSGIGSAAAGALLDRVGNNLFPSQAFGIFLIGHLLGTLLLGVGLLRSGRVSAWASIAVIAGDVLHPIAYVVAHLQVLDVIAYLVLAAGLAGAARAVLATPNKDWDLAPSNQDNAAPFGSK